MELEKIGERIETITTVRDTPASITLALGEAAHSYDIVIVSGGIGPTDDDVTMKAVARASGTRTRDGIPCGAARLKNGAGTADGALARIGVAKVFVVPGVPLEFEYFVKNHIVPAISPAGGGKTAGHKVLKAFGISEARINELIGEELSKIPGLGISYLPVLPEIHLRLKAAGSAGKVRETIAAGEKVIRSRLGNAVWGSDDDTLPSVMGKRLLEAGLKLAVAESCTGGMISSLITSVPGCSEYFRLGAVTYSNESKSEVLGVGKETLNRFGAVSEEVVMEMCSGLRSLTAAEVVAAVSGIAGPGGGTGEKPVGTVFLAVGVHERFVCERYVLPVGREKFRRVVSWRVMWTIWNLLSGAGAGNGGVR
jgi:nicotinamide-nucleotide amidase